MRRAAISAPLLLALWAPSLGRAVGYDYVVVASSDSGVFAPLSFSLVPSIGNDGSIAFLATPTGSAQAGIFIGSTPGRRLADYTRVTPPGTTVQQIGSVLGGAVAFTGQSGAQAGVFRWSAGVTTPILAGSQSIPPAVNASGVLAYVDDAGALRIALSQGSTTLIQNGDQIAGGTISHVFSFVYPDINDAGQVAFYPLIFLPNTSCDEPVMRTFPGGAEVIGLGGGDTCDFFQAASVPLAINELGSVAYAPEIFDEILGEMVDTVAVNSSKVWDARDPAFASHLHVTDVALNDSGEVAFRLEGSLADGVYTGSDPASDKVLAIGEPLCGSTVIGVDFQRYGIDPLGRMALFVALADGRRLIVRAEPVLGPGGACQTVPEPAAPEAAIAALLAVAATGRRRVQIRCVRSGR